MYLFIYLIVDINMSGNDINDIYTLDEKKKEPGFILILLFLVSVPLVRMWMVLKIQLIFTGSILIYLMYKRKMRGALLKAHLIVTILSILGTLAGLYMSVLCSITNPPEPELYFVYWFTIIFLLLTIIEITYVILLSKYKKYCTNTNKKIIISQIIISILMILFALYFDKKMLEIL